MEEIGNLSSHDKVNVDVGGTSSSLFNFATYEGSSDDYLELIRTFAAAPPFRSATVDELVVADDFHRRALRPEDFEFLKFRKPVRHDNVSRLPSLASHRTLLSIYELDVMRPPRAADAAAWETFTAFYDERNRSLGARIAPFLESYAFSYLRSGPVNGAQNRSTDSVLLATEALSRIVDEERDFWDKTFARLLRHDYLQEGLRFIMIQRWALAQSQRRALSRAAGSGFFDMLLASEWPRLHGLTADADPLSIGAVAERVAQAVDVTGKPHAYWQFYLPTSLAKTNLLYALARRPDRAFALTGAAFAAEAEWLAFGAALQRACPHLVPAGRAGTVDQAFLQARSDLDTRFSRTLRRCEDRYGDAAFDQIVSGFHAREHLSERGRWDLGEQLRWLSAIPRYVAFAHRISERIEVECPGIDRETFVEPLEMCSTTHVHNDHRLVTIESGDMLFWGNLGMQLAMHPGDKVLIPDGRLHGSTVTSAECTYHQPIIPDDWVAALVAELDAPDVVSPGDGRTQPPASPRSTARAIG
ncbi:peptide synthetase [Robbsia andropogonis]|uniref:peptide synthetase n=1 Tax=Robbsia andropogonis TaxID=28092 RepID=UPI003D1D82E4